MLPINVRLQTCADFVTKNGVVCDVGTDHAYLVAYLISSGKCTSAIAADINDNPLKVARQTLLKFGVLNKVQIIKSDGLLNVPPKGITDVVIAGMGAELISEIMSKADWLKNGVNLVLQPMTHVSYLRKWLYNNGYEIAAEKAVKENKYIYTIMKVIYSGNFVEIDEIVENIGKMDLSDESSRAYAEKQIHRLEKAGLNIQKSSRDIANNMLLTAEKIKHLLEGNHDNC